MLLRIWDYFVYKVNQLVGWHLQHEMKNGSEQHEKELQEDSNSLDS
jgi:hypothetical protein